MDVETACRVDAEFSAKARIQMMTDGTTAVVAVVHDGKVYVGNGKWLSPAPIAGNLIYPRVFQPATRGRY
jgi:hypothetical protein